MGCFFGVPVVSEANNGVFLRGPRCERSEQWGVSSGSPLRTNVSGGECYSLTVIISLPAALTAEARSE